MATKKVNLRLDDYVRGIEGLRPEEQLTLVEIISVKLRKLLRQKKPSHSIMELEGLGAYIWKDMDAQRYVNEERKSWG
jgi:hypothetical protein